MDVTAFPTLDPQLADLVAALPEMTNTLDDVPAARELLRAFMPGGAVAGEEDLEITDLIAPGGPGGTDVPVRLYRPRDAADTTLPAVLYIHGGGFCLGDVAMEQGGAVGLALALNAAVLSVEYRLAPEHPHPAPVEDCYTALRYLAGLDGVDPNRIAVHGTSAGGALAAATALLSRDRGGPALCFQSLSIPVLDDRLDTPSMRAFVATPAWARPQAIKSWELYLGGAEADQYAAPARAEDLAGLPPAYVVTCELDPLRDEGILYAMRLLAAGVSVELHSFPGTFHGSTMVPGADVVRRMNAELVGALKRALERARTDNG